MGFLVPPGEEWIEAVGKAIPGVQGLGEALGESGAAQRQRGTRFFLRLGEALALFLDGLGQRRHRCRRGLRVLGLHRPSGPFEIQDRGGERQESEGLSVPLGASIEVGETRVDRPGEAQPVHLSFARQGFEIHCVEACAPLLLEAGQTSATRGIQRQVVETPQRLAVGAVSGEEGRGVGSRDRPRRRFLGRSEGRAGSEREGGKERGESRREGAGHSGQSRPRRPPRKRALRCYWTTMARGSVGAGWRRASTIPWAKKFRPRKAGFIGTVKECWKTPVPQPIEMGLGPMSRSTPW